MAEMRELPLHEAAVRAPPRPIRPFDHGCAAAHVERVVRVDAVESSTVELAAGLVPAAHVDDDRRVAAPREPDAPAR